MNGRCFCACDFREKGPRRRNKFDGVKERRARISDSSFCRGVAPRIFIRPEIKCYPRIYLRVRWEINFRLLIRDYKASPDRNALYLRTRKTWNIGTILYGRPLPRDLRIPPTERRCSVLRVYTGCL